jgi:hypothetical protein
MAYPPRPAGAFKNGWRCPWAAMHPSIATAEFLGIMCWVPAPKTGYQWIQWTQRRLVILRKCTWVSLGPMIDIWLIVSLWLRCLLRNLGSLWLDETLGCFWRTQRENRVVSTLFGMRPEGWRLSKSSAIFKSAHLQIWKSQDNKKSGWASEIRITSS